MSAFRRRTAFAAPFVVVVACGGSQRNDSPDDFGTWTVMKSGDECHANVIERCPRGALCNPPPPSFVECPPMDAETYSVTLVQRADETCAIVPPGCQDLACAVQSTPCPLPFGAPWPARGPYFVVSHHESGCIAREEEACPDSDLACARAIECPADFRAAPATVRVGRSRDECVVLPEGCSDGDCGTRTACPMPAGKDVAPSEWDGERKGYACTVTSRGLFNGERQQKIVCPQGSAQGFFKINRVTEPTGCELRVGTSPALPTDCPPDP
jgi:hypothetical protein